MSEKIFVDTNIILDLLAKREPFYQAAKSLFKLSELGEVELLVSALSFVNIQYILRKQVKKEEAKSTLKRLRLISKVCSVGQKEIDLAISSDWKDFEDAVQYYAAINNNCKLILTRNLRGFKAAQIAVMTAEEFIKSREN